MLNRIVNNDETNQVIRVIQKQKRAENIINDINDKELKIHASTKAAEANIEKRKKKEDYMNKKVQ